MSKGFLCCATVKIGWMNIVFGSILVGHFQSGGGCDGLFQSSVASLSSNNLGYLIMYIIFLFIMWLGCCSKVASLIMVELVSL